MKEKKRLAMEMLEMIFEQRESYSAPVDSLGCAALSKAPSEKLRRFQVLISLLLSSQTRDADTAEAFRNLDNSLPQIKEGEAWEPREKGLTPENVASADQDYLCELIRKVGFHNRKAHYMKNVAAKVVMKGEIPDTAEGLMALPGIGQKMAYLAMQHAWNRCEGIGVDTHVHRISNRIGLVRTKTPEQTRAALENTLPRAQWNKVNHTLVGFGQVFCTAMRPRCVECRLSDLCPSSQARATKSKASLRREGKQKGVVLGERWAQGSS
jgi:endonuclease III